MPTTSGPCASAGCQARDGETIRWQRWTASLRQCAKPWTFSRAVRLAAVGATGFALSCRTPGAERNSPASDPSSGVRKAHAPMAVPQAQLDASPDGSSPKNASRSGPVPLPEITPILRAAATAGSPAHELWLDVPELGLSERLATFTPKPPLICGPRVYIGDTTGVSGFVGVTCDLGAAEARTALRLDNGELFLNDRVLGTPKGVKAGGPPRILRRYGVESLLEPPASLASCDTPPRTITVRIVEVETDRGPALFVEVPELKLRFKWRDRTDRERCWSERLTAARMMRTFCHVSKLELRHVADTIRVLEHIDHMELQFEALVGIRLPCGARVRFIPFALRDAKYSPPAQSLCDSRCVDTSITCHANCAESTRTKTPSLPPLVKPAQSDVGFWSSGARPGACAS